MSIGAFHPKSRQKNQEVGTGDHAVAVHILRAVGETAKFTEQSEQVVYGGNAVLVDVARAGRQLGARDKPIAIDVSAERQERGFWVEVGIGVVAVVVVEHPARRRDATKVLRQTIGLVSKPIAIGVGPCRGGKQAAAVVFGGAHQEIAGFWVGAPREFIAIAHAVAI